MAVNDVIQNARQLPSGAVFHRCALQVNPHHYGSTYRGDAPSGDAGSHAKAIIRKASELGVSVLAITDHNHVGGVTAFRTAADSKGIHIFPGFELSSSEGIHVLCIYAPDTADDTLARYLGVFGITDTNFSARLADKNFVEILAKVREQGGVAIAAHATNDNGLLKVLGGQARVRAWRSEDLLAVQIPGPVEDLPSEYKLIVENRNPDYSRDHAAEERLAIAVVNAKDVAKPEDLDDRAATCWIKMSEVSIEGLRQAFLDPGSRIRLNPEEGHLEPEEHAEFVALAWEGGFLDGAAIHFNPNLNVLVGGRGTGKSTVVESIRAVLGLDAVGDEARKAHEGIVRHVLKSGTKISLLVRAHRPAMREYRIERTIPNPPPVRDDQGGVSNLLPWEVLPRVEVFGQHEISELTKSREKLTRLLDRFVERDDDLPRRKAHLRRALEKNRKSLLDTRAELRRIDERLAALPGLEETLQRFREAGLEERLKEQSLLVREERLLASVPERLASLRECAETLEREVPIDRAFLSAKALEDLPGKEILGRLNAVFEALDRDLQRNRAGPESGARARGRGRLRSAHRVGRAQEGRPVRLREDSPRAAEVARGRRGVHPPPASRKDKNLLARQWKGAQGLAEDVRHYGQWMRDEAEKRIGHLYPKVEVTTEMVKVRPDLKQYAGKKLTVIASLWARTVKSPNPAFAQVDVPLASTFMLSTKAGKEAYVEPVIEDGGYRFAVKVGKPKDAEGAKNGTAAGKRAAFKCVMSGTPLPYDYIRTEGQAGRMGARLMAIVAEGERGRAYLAPTPQMEALAPTAKPEWKPETPLHGKCRVNVSNYGFDQYGDLFTPRQLVALTTFSDLVQEARERVQCDALKAGLPADLKPLRDGGTGVTAYAEAVVVYLAIAVSRIANYGSTICTWHWGVKYETVTSAFGRQALPMSWDYAEGNPLSGSSGNWIGGIDWIARVMMNLPGRERGDAYQADAASAGSLNGKAVSTDPPYYDNIGYADLSDFFCVWLRRSLRPVFPDLFATLAVPKAEELVATPYRHGSKEKAETFFLDGMTQAMHRLADQSHPAFPVTIYYAFKQAESDSVDGTASTGWETFIDAVIRAGFAITGTWPMRTEYTGNLKKNVSALASSIVLVCRKRAADVLAATRREFVTALKAELPQALAHLQRGKIAPVDLAQAAIGPGMAVYTRYARVLDAEGKPLSVREALALINQTLDEALASQEGDFDADSRWALTWFEQSGFDEGEYGLAEQLSKSKNTSVAGMVEAGILESKRGKVRLLAPTDLPAGWDPATDPRLTAWEIVHHLIRALASGEGAAAELVAKLGAKAEIARELAYRLYTLCERKKRAAEALAYNGLVQSWPEIARLAREGGKPKPEQGALFGEPEE